MLSAAEQTSAKSKHNKARYRVPFDFAPPAPRSGRTEYGRGQTGTRALLA